MRVGIFGILITQHQPVRVAQKVDNSGRFVIMHSYKVM